MSFAFRDNNFEVHPAIVNIFIINIVFLLLQHFFPIFDQYVALYYVKSEYFYVYQFVTHMFAHADIPHLFSNMLGVYIFAPLLIRVWGVKRFYFFYLATGIGAGLLYSGIKYYEIMRIQEGMLTYISNPNPNAFAQFFSDYFPNLHNDQIINFGNAFQEQSTNPQNIQDSILYVQSAFYQLGGVNTPSLGASGAIFGILAASALLFPNTEKLFVLIPFPIKVKFLVGGYLVYEIWKLIENNPNDNVAHWAHLGGAMVGFVIIKIWQQNRRTFY